MTSTLPTRPVPSRMGALFARHGVGTPGGRTYHEFAEDAGLGHTTVRKMARAVTPGEPVTYYKLDEQVGKIARELGTTRSRVRSALERDIAVSQGPARPGPVDEVLALLPKLDERDRERVLDALAAL